MFELGLGSVLELGLESVLELGSALELGLGSVLGLVLGSVGKKPSSSHDKGKKPSLGSLTFFLFLQADS